MNTLDQPFSLDQEREIIQFVDERLFEFASQDLQEEVEKLENFIDDKCNEAIEKMEFEMFRMRKELEDQFNLKIRKSFWKWWK